LRAASAIITPRYTALFDIIVAYAAIIAVIFAAAYAMLAIVATR